MTSRRKKGPRSLDMFPAAVGATAPQREVLEEPARPAPEHLEVPWQLRLTGPTCLQVDFTGVEEDDRVSARFSIADEATGTEIVEIARGEFLSFAAEIQGGL